MCGISFSRSMASTSSSPSFAETSCRLSRIQITEASCWRDDVGSHHLVVLVLEHVAVPDVAASIAFELDDDACDREGVNTGNVLPSHLAGSESVGGSGEDDLAGELVDSYIEGPAVEHLEADHVQVDGVGVVGEIDEGPDLGGVEDGSFGDGHVPVRAVEEHDAGAAKAVLVVGECELAGADGGGLGDADDGAESR